MITAPVGSIFISVLGPILLSKGDNQVGSCDVIVGSAQGIAEANEEGCTV